MRVACVHPAPPLSDRTTAKKKKESVLQQQVRQKYENAESPTYVRVRVSVGEKAKGALHHAGVVAHASVRPRLTHAHTIYAERKEKLRSAPPRASEPIRIRLNQWRSPVPPHRPAPPPPPPPQQVVHILPYVTPEKIKIHGLIVRVHTTRYQS